jgi:hypothetical protein
LSLVQSHRKTELTVDIRADKLRPDRPAVLDACTRNGISRVSPRASPFHAHEPPAKMFYCVHGAAFSALWSCIYFVDQQRTDNLPMMDVIPAKLIDEAMSGGGQPAAAKN